MIHCTNKALNVLLLFYILALHYALCSEFPERECCDTVYSAVPNPEPAPTSPTLLTQVIPSTITVNHTGNYLRMYFNINEQLRMYSYRYAVGIIYKENIVGVFFS